MQNLTDTATTTTKFLLENSSLPYRDLVEKVRVLPQFHEEVLDYLLGERASMDIILKFVEASPALHTPETLTKLLASYRVIYHLKKIMKLPFAQVQQTIEEFLYVYPAPSAWGILLLLWEFKFARTPEVFEAFLKASPDEYEAQLLKGLCPEYAAWLAASRR